MCSIYFNINKRFYNFTLYIESQFIRISDLFLLKFLIEPIVVTSTIETENWFFSLSLSFFLSTFYSFLRDNFLPYNIPSRACKGRKRKKGKRVSITSTLLFSQISLGNLSACYFSKMRFASESPNIYKYTLNRHSYFSVCVFQ